MHYSSKKNSMTGKTENYIHSYSFKVKPEHIDQLDHVNNVVYVQWIQDAAVNHWNSVAPDNIKEKFVWVIVRHEIDYKYPAKLNEELLIKTQVLNAQGVSSIRKVGIYRKTDMKLLVESQTTWCMMDSGTFRPTRITDEVKKLFLPD
jgi:acyl-CoA thioester hydrolase